VPRYANLTKCLFLLVPQEGYGTAPSVDGNLCPIHNANLKCLSSVMHSVVYLACVLWARSALLTTLARSWRRPPNITGNVEGAPVSISGPEVGG
jgi:hypothetical protein